MFTRQRDGGADEIFDGSLALGFEPPPRPIRYASARGRVGLGISQSEPSALDSEPQRAIQLDTSKNR